MGSQREAMTERLTHSSHHTQECKVESVSSTIRNETKIFTLATFIQCHFGSSRHDNLEKAMASHSSTLAWKISWTEEAAGLGVTSVEHDLVTKPPPQSWLLKILRCFK